MGKRKQLDFELSFFESLHQRMPKDVKVVSILAHIYTEIGAIDSGLKMDRKLARLTPDNPLVHYNLACSLCLKGRFSDAVRSLRTAIDLGYEDFIWMKNDPDLCDLQSYYGYLGLLDELGLL